MKTIAQLMEEKEHGAKPGYGKGVGEPARRAGGTDICKCPKCGYKTSHSRGAPCNKIKCPKCGAMMVGK